MKFYLAQILLFISISVSSQQLDVDGNAKINGALEVSGNITNVSDPINDQDAVTKNYIVIMSELLLDAGLNGIVLDIDSNVYKTIKIGNQVWMTENLKTTRYNDGSPIPNVTDNTTWSTSNIETAAFCWYDNDSVGYSQLYGALYSFRVGSESNTFNVCPIGWDVPNQTDWLELRSFLSQKRYSHDGANDLDFGKSLASTFRWDANGTVGNVGYDLGSNNSTKFNGFPGGSRSSNDGSFTEIGEKGKWWAASAGPLAGGILWQLCYDDDGLENSVISGYTGASIRCIRK